MYGLREKHIKSINSIFSKYPQIEKAILYGSRAKGNFRNGSDIDLTLVGYDLDITTLFKIETELDDLLLPYKIDLSILHKIENPNLLNHIKRVGITFYMSAKPQVDEKMTSEWKEYILEAFAEINPTEGQPEGTIVKKIAMEMDSEAKEKGLTDFEYVFYTAVADNESAKDLMQKDKLRELAIILSERVKANASIDWTIKESMRAKLKVIIKRTLRQFSYPPDMQKLATETILKQAELIANELTND